MTTTDQYREITLAELIASESGLFEQARASTNLPAVKVNLALFEALESAGILHVLGMFTPDEQLVGYAVFTVGAHPLHGDRNCCVCISVFVEEGHRQLAGSTNLLKLVEERGKAVGADMMLWTVRTGSPLEKVLPRMGAVPMDTTYGKDL